MGRGFSTDLSGIDSVKKKKVRDDHYHKLISKGDRKQASSYNQEREKKTKSFTIRTTLCDSRRLTDNEKRRRHGEGNRCIRASRTQSANERS